MMNGTPHGLAANDTRTSGGLGPDSTVTGPVQPSERLKLLDVLRGFALFGILVVNWNDTSGTLYSWVEFLAEGSFYPMFSFLFGLGFALQLIRAEEAGRPFVVRYVWRSALLLAIGFLHAGFIWSGDILRKYAYVAVALLFVRRWHPRVLVGAALVFLAIGVSPTYQYVQPGRAFLRADPEQAGREFVQTSAATAMRQERVAVVIDRIPGLTQRYRFQLEYSVPAAISSLSAPAAANWWRINGDVICMFLLGLWAGRRRLVREPERHTALLVSVAVVGLIVGVAGNGIGSFGDTFEAIGIKMPEALSGWNLDYSLGNIGLTVFYLSALTLLFTWSRFAARLLGPIGWAGWMGLTNYLLQSVFFGIVFRPTVFGFRVSGWRQFLVLTAFFGLQILWSRWWLTRFRFGPAEWLWRSLTWWRLQPMRLSTRTTAGDAA